LWRIPQFDSPATAAKALGLVTIFTWECCAAMAKYVVRTGSMRTLGVCTTRNEEYPRATRVIVRTDRGLEAGDVLCEATDEAMAQLSDPGRGQILREMTGEDENEQYRLHAQERRAFETCRRLITELALEMDLVDVEHIFGGERIVFYYLSESRVDFRELVKSLAGEFQTRIEMRQIGVRDEAKLLADYGDCGKPVCCNTHLSAMPPVSMKMAKLQKATLDPTKISGRCGRLKCCLRYEYDTYEELQKSLPRVGSEVLTGKGRARVLAHEILASQLLIETEDHRRVLIPASDVLTVLAKK
jgi:cell fate regulator YaaT (PSP1 superfamily)